MINLVLHLIGSPLSYLTGLYLNANLKRAGRKLAEALENLEAVAGPHDPQVLHCRETLRLCLAMQETWQKKPHKPKRE